MRYIKGTLVLLITIFMLVMVTTPVMASEYLSPSTINAKDDSQTAAKAQNIAGNILSIVQVVGISVAVIVLIFVAIKYISAAPNDKAEIKKHMVVYVVGAVILFATSGILGIIQNFAKVFDETSGGGGGSAPSITSTQTAPNPSRITING